MVEDVRERGNPPPFILRHAPLLALARCGHMWPHRFLRHVPLLALVRYGHMWPYRFLYHIPLLAFCAVAICGPIASSGLLIV